MQQLLNPAPRVALFTDTFEEANGVATLSRNMVAFARDRELPLLLLRGGEHTCVLREGSVEILQLKRGAAAFGVDKDLHFDPLLTRYKKLVTEHLLAFKPDLIHITGPGDIGFLGLLLSHLLRVPLAASWHTNLHEYLARRLSRVFRFTPKKMVDRASDAVERQSLRGLLRFYQTAHFVMAPNCAMVDLLHLRTGRPSFLMRHGVDLRTYSPARNANGNHCFCIGYVGRLTTEKNVRLFAELERQLAAAGESNFKFLIVGDGGQQRWLQKNLQRAEFPGVLHGDELSNAYRRMDVFVFPSLTDTFGLVILEAMASGVPVVLAPETGKNIGIQDGVSGILSQDFSESVLRLMHNVPLKKEMGEAARIFALANSWQPVFEHLYQTYAEGLKTPDQRRLERERQSQKKRDS